MDIALSPEKVINIYKKKKPGEDIKVILYDDIIESNNVDEVFNEDNKIIIFYPALRIKM